MISRLEVLSAQRRSCSFIGFTIVFCLLTSLGTACSTAQSPRDPAKERALKITVPFTITAAGDIIEPQPILSGSPDFQRLVQVMRDSDVGFANMESSLVNFRTFSGPVTGTEASLKVGEAIKTMGITLMNHANNHAFDGGVLGMQSTDAALDDLGIIHAGTGRDLQEARAAQFLETPKGRVGLVGIFAIDDSSNFGPAYSRTEATYRNGDLGGAAGVDPLHLTAYHIVSAEDLRTLRETSAKALGQPQAHEVTDPPNSPDRFKFFDEWFQAGTDVGTVHYEMNHADEERILDSVRNGKTSADFMLVSIHAHQTISFTPRTQSGPGVPDAIAPGQMKEGTDHFPTDFLRKLAHDSIDNGADMFVAHGVHALAGVEIYKGKPIFYGVSNFVFQFGLQLGSGYDVYANERALSGLENAASQEAVLGKCFFDEGELKEVRLYPVDLGGPRRPISQMGIPETPDPELADRILQHLQEYSKPFGSVISIETHVGVIRVDTDRPR